MEWLIALIVGMLIMKLMPSAGNFVLGFIGGLFKLAFVFSGCLIAVFLFLKLIGG